MDDGDDIDADWQAIREDLRTVLSDAFGQIVTSRAKGALSSEARAQLKQDFERLRRIATSVRPPRIALVGRNSVALGDIFREMFHELPGDLDTKESLGQGRWYDYDIGRGEFRLLDMRAEPGEEPQFKGLRYDAPDVVIAVAPPGDEETGEVVDALVRADERTFEEHGVGAALVAAVVRHDEGHDIAQFKTLRAFRRAFGERDLDQHYAPIVNGRPGKLVSIVMEELPAEVRLSTGRLVADPKVKREVADSLIRMCASLNGTIATVPLPVADIVPITSVQLSMIAGVAYVSGREVSVSSVGEFITALGVNVGAGLAFREFVRALVHLIPVAGSVVSASIAAGATYTLGRSAVRYYIPG